MKSRDEYVARLQSQLGVWNAQVDAWEAKANASTAAMKADYAKQIADLKSKRDDLQSRMRKIQGSSGDAWSELAAGADTAWKAMSEAFTAAASKFR